MTDGAKAAVQRLQYDSPTIECLGKVADITQAASFQGASPADGVPYGGASSSGGGGSPHHS